MKKIFKVSCLLAFLFYLASCSSDDDSTKFININLGFPVAFQFYPNHLIPVDCEALDEFNLKLVIETQKTVPSLKNEPAPYRKGKELLVSERTVNVIYNDKSFIENEAKQIADALIDEFESVTRTCSDLPDTN